MFYYIQAAVYVYTSAAIIVCLVGWLFEKLRIFPHAIHFSTRVGRCSSFAVGAVVLTLIVGNNFLAAYPGNVTLIENVTAAVTLIAFWYSLSHIHASYVQINVMWKVYKKLEEYVYSHIHDMDRERYSAFVEEIRADELFFHVDPQYYELYDDATVRLALDLNII